LIKSSQKAVRVAEKRRRRNKSVRHTIKTYLTKAQNSISGDEPEAAKASVVQAASVLDRAAQKGVIHPRNAARRKSRLMKKLNQTFSE